MVHVSSVEATGSVSVTMEALHLVTFSVQMQKNTMNAQDLCNFRFAFMHIKSLLKRCQILKEKVCFHSGSKSFLLVCLC